MNFLCTGCGACCRLAGRMNGAKYGLPIKEDGSCAHLIGSKCSIYETRPDVCRVDKMMFNDNNLSKKDYYKKTSSICHSMIDYLGIDPHYKVNLDDYDL